jgi:phytoene synthase
MNQLASSPTAAEPNAAQATVQICHDVMSHHAKSFRWAAAFLSLEQRNDTAVAYSFCRAVDDAVDEAPTPASAAENLGLIEEMLAGKIAADALTVAYRDVANRRNFGIHPAQELLKGARSDLGIVLFKDDVELLTYCFRVAGTVGLMMCGILGVRDLTARRYAIDLGIAMQLTNICRDVLEDAARGRVYLPQERLRKAGVSQQELIDFAEPLRRKSDFDDGQMRTLRRSVSLVVKDLLNLADDKYESARLGYAALPTRPRLSVMVAAELYRSIGHRLRDDEQADALKGRVVVPPLRKLFITIRTTLGWFKATMLAMGIRRPAARLRFDKS